MSCSAATAVAGSVGTVHGMSYASDLTDEQWALLEPVVNAPGKRGPEHAPDLRRVVDAMLYISHTGCQWRFLPESFEPWTRVWSQFRRWSRNGTWARALTVLHKAAREADGRTEATPSMVVIGTHLARGASNGGFTFHDRGGPYGRTRGAERVVAVDVTGLPVGALVLPAHPPRLARRGRPWPAGTRPPTGEVVREHHHLSDRLAAGGLHRDRPASPVSCPWTPSPDPSRGVGVGRSPCAHRGTCAGPCASCSDLYSASAGVTPAPEIRRCQTVWSDCLRTRKRRMVASPDRVLLIGSRSVLARPGDEKRMPSPSRTGSTYTRISSTSPRCRH